MTGDTRWWHAPARFVHYRIALLALLLVCVLAYAARDRSVRAERTQWKRPVEVAVVVVRVGAVDEGAVGQLRARTPALERALEQQFMRYRGGLERPIRFGVLGPVDAGEPPVPASDGLVDLGKQAWAMANWRAPIDKNAQVDLRAWDARVYLVVHPAKHGPQFVEGASEQGGRNGMTSVELDGTMVDLALFVTAHETMHLLGATDQYDASGRTLYEPVGVNQVELMGHGKVLPDGSSAPPDSLDQLWVGTRTAREVGWASTLK